MVSWILDKLFKRNYYDRAIYFLVVVFISSIASLSNRSNWISFFQTLAKRYDTDDLLRIIIEIAGVLVIGGSWSLSIISGLLLIALITIRVKVSSGALNVERFYEREFDYYQTQIEAFNFKSAYHKLNDIEKKISQSSLSKLSKPLMARLNFLLGESISFLNRQENLRWNYYIKAYELLKSHIPYKERYCVTLYQMGNTKEAYLIAEEILEETKLSGRAWAVKYLEQPTGTLEEISQDALRDKDFVRIFGYYLIKRKEHKLLGQLFKNEVESLKPAEIEINYSSVSYFFFIAGHALERVVQRTSLPLFEYLRLESQELVLAEKIYSSILDAMKSSEGRESDLYRRAHFYQNLANYLIDPKSELAKKSSEIYQEQLEDISSEVMFHFVVIGLSQNELFEEMVELCNSVFDADKEFFLGLAHFHLGHTVQAQTSWTKFFADLEQIVDVGFQYLLFAIASLRSGEVDVRNFFDLYFANKQFKSSLERALLSQFVDPLAEGAEATQSQKLISDSWEEISCFDVNKIRAFLEIHFRRSEFSLCIEFIENYQNPDKLHPSIEFYYVRCLYHLNHKLHRARQGYSHLRSLKLVWVLLKEELNLALKTEDFQTVKEVSGIALGEYKLDIFKYYYVYALEKLDDRQTLEVFVSQDLSTIDLDFQKTIDLCALLIRNEWFELGINLAFRKVISDYSNPVLKEAYLDK